MNAPYTHIIPLPPHAVAISDADEEVFLLYTRLAALKSEDNEDNSHFRGLGFLDAQQDTIQVHVDLTPPTTISPTIPKARHGRSAPRKAGGKGKGRQDEAISLEFELFQDKTALRSRSGDTGSVLWRASIDVARLVLQQTRFPTPDALFDSHKLSTARCIELGAGTGLLAVALGPLFRRYTATDVPVLVPLLRKNISHTQRSRSSISAAALDWMLPAHRQLPDDPLADPVDLILAVDCLYHPSLIPPLLSTLSTLCIPGRTTVLVVSELRAEDVVREFLEGWLSRPREEGWRIWNVNGEGGKRLMGERYAVWMAWRAVEPEG
ncbi:putative methyltransferase-domain-containing protein [Amylostereum chailletii]|nr:putative methyltransferase-domain-containing protein [Amylostereum chailletii]